jgi:hypothetical protein
MKSRPRATVRKYEKEIEDVCVEMVAKLLPLEERTPEGIELARKSWRTLEIKKQSRLVLESFSDRELEERIKLLPSFPMMVRKVLKRTVKNLPHARGGRPLDLTTEVRRKLCSEVGALMGNEGYQLREAQNFVAKKNGLSLRSVQRAWQERTDKK